MDRRDRDRDRHRDRRRHDDTDRDHHRSDRRRDRSRSRRRSVSKSRHDRDRSKSKRRSNSRSRHDRSRSRRRSTSKSRHERRRSRSKSSSRRRRSPTRSRPKKEEHSRSTPPPPSISIVESVPYSSRKDKDMLSEKMKQSSPDMISQMEKHNKKPGAYCNLKLDEPIDKEKIHKEIEEKLRETLAREGIEYNAPKPEATHPVFANDGSFLEIFKKMQEAQQETHTEPQLQQQPSTSFAPPMLPVSNTVPRPQIPMFGRRRGGKILKTGVVAKPKNADNDSHTDPKDFWTIYLREVNKYKNAACDSDAQSRPLVK